MTLIIDGYNLLNVTGIVGCGRRPASLERSRRALLDFLAASLNPDQLPHTTVVFDAKDSPPKLPQLVVHRGLTVRYATGYDNADALIEELIRAESAPRQLIVVSSDHGIQRMARRRRATAIDSDQWYAGLVQQRRVERLNDEPTDVKPRVPLSAAEVEAWMREFADRPVGCAPGDSDDTAETSPADAEVMDLDNPFPPGYGEDLLQE
jgi:predicted RNA-binding protein with PIN domain